MRHINSMHKIKTIKKTYILPLLAFALAGVVFAYHTAPGHAQSVQQLQGEIDQLESEINKSQNRLEELRTREDTLENKLEIIRTDINKIQKQLQQTRDEIAAKKAEIRETERELQRKKEQMQDNAETLYKEGDPSTLEILFSSDSFSEFISRKQYLDSVKKSLDESAARVKELQEKLKEEKAVLEEKRQKQANKKQALESRRNEQQQLLEETQGREEKYQEKLARERRALEKANKQLQEELARRSSVYSGDVDFSGSSYPYPNACMNPYKKPQYINGSNCTARMGGYYDRQCTSYAYWRRGNIGRPVPGYWGNGGNWAYAADEAGYKVNYSPAKGAIGVTGGSSYGHVFIVEKVVEGGNAVIASQYNVPNSQTNWEYGKYSVVKYNDLSGIQFIHDRH